MSSSAANSRGVVCPNCAHSLKIKNIKPGHHRPRCPHCRSKLSLTIHDDPDQPAEIELLEAGPSDPDDAAYIEEVPLILGGYRIIKRLGQGGMGTVYLAKQMSLDRNVALKVLHPDWVTERRVLVRFLREAHAAAKLSHQHIVQIFDIGNEGKHHFFSMEYVAGATLAELVRTQGPLDPATAINYIVQAARGLQFAHEHGLVHRDIKPDNLMVTAQGVIKVADLGLVKTGDPEENLHKEGRRQRRRGGDDSPDLTRLGTGMGTPAYSAPEQLRDASSVDARADIYSLGCTFYTLLEGQPPFRGESGMAIMLKHMSEAPVPPTNVQPGVLATLWPILSRMLAKDPDERFSSMAEVAAVLEQSRKGSRKREKPTEEDVAALGRYVAAFQADPFARSTPRVLVGVFVVSWFLAFGSMLFGSWDFLLGLFLLPLLALMCRVLIRGLAQHTVMITRLRDYTLTNFKAWLLLLLLVGGGGTLLWWLDLYLAFLGALGGGIVLGALIYFLLDRQTVAQRQEHLDKTQKLLQRMRLRGVTEDGLRLFVAQFTGTHWEEFYEAVFGYDALVQVRSEQIADASGRPRDFRPGIRDNVIAWLDAQLGRTAPPPPPVRTPTPHV